MKKTKGASCSTLLGICSILLTLGFLFLASSADQDERSRDNAKKSWGVIQGKETPIDW